MQANPNMLSLLNDWIRPHHIKNYEKIAVIITKLSGNKQKWKKEQDLTDSRLQAPEFSLYSPYGY
jgi:hypothetical protein